MMLVQEDRKLLAQGLVALGAMAGGHGIFEQPLLNVLRQLAPGRDDGLTKRK
jgi:hypothetical protein